MNKKLRALVVDDDEDICLVVSRILKNMGHESVCAYDYETAMELFENNRFDYVVLDMELPFRAGGPMVIDAGMQALATIRNKYDKNQMPVFVFTSKLDSLETAGPICRQCSRKDANDVILKSEMNSKKHVFEKTILEGLGNRTSIPKVLSNSKEWLFRIPHENGTKMTWTTRAKNGRERSYDLGLGTIRGRLLDCIYMSLDKSNVICKADIIVASRHWKSDVYSPKDKGPSRGPMKGHAAFFKKQLGIKITIRSEDIIVEQPDE